MAAQVFKVEKYSDCVIVFAMAEPLSSMQTDHTITDIWGGVTDPAAHNPDAFRYLVHMDHGLTISRWNRRNASFLEAHPALKGAFYVDDLTRLTLRPYLSASLIDQTRMNTFTGRLGLILHVPAAGVVANSPEDMYVADEHSLERARRRPALDAETLLARTKDHNEVVCTTETVAVAGLLYLTDGWPNRRSQRPNYRYVCERAAELALPLVELEPNEESRHNRYSAANYVD